MRSTRRLSTAIVPSVPPGSLLCHMTATPPRVRAVQPVPLPPLSDSLLSQEDAGAHWSFDEDLDIVSMADVDEEELFEAAQPDAKRIGADAAATAAGTESVAVPSITTQHRPWLWAGEKIGTSWRWTTPSGLSGRSGTRTPDGVHSGHPDEFLDFDAPLQAPSKPRPSGSRRRADCFNAYDTKRADDANVLEFNFIEGFVLAEQTSARVRRTAARKLEATEETRLAVQVAELKGISHISSITGTDHYHAGEDDLLRKIHHAEQAFVSRKMVYAKAAQVAGAERVRGFLQDLLRGRQEVWTRRHGRGVRFQALVQALNRTDTRVVVLERQIAARLYRKRKTDLNELHMAQTLEDAKYLESMMDVLDTLQAAKERAALEV